MHTRTVQPQRLPPAHCTRIAARKHDRWHQSCSSSCWGNRCASPLSICWHVKTKSSSHTGGNNSLQLLNCILEKGSSLTSVTVSNMIKFIWTREKKRLISTHAQVWWYDQTVRQNEKRAYRAITVSDDWHRRQSKLERDVQNKTLINRVYWHLAWRCQCERCPVTPRQSKQSVNHCLMKFFEVFIHIWMISALEKSARIHWWPHTATKWIHRGDQWENRYRRSYLSKKQSQFVNGARC